MVERARTDRLDEWYRNMEAPLLPIFLLPFSPAQVDQIKQRWHDLRYVRVDLWQQLDKARTNRGAPSAEGHPHYQLALRSLGQLEGRLWGIVAPPPEYYRRAVKDHVGAERGRFQAQVLAGQEERRLQKKYSRQLLQTEQISFLLAALLETADSFCQEKKE